VACKCWLRDVASSLLSSGLTVTMVLSSACVGRNEGSGSLVVSHTMSVEEIDHIYKL